MLIYLILMGMTITTNNKRWIYLAKIYFLNHLNHNLNHYLNHQLNRHNNIGYGKIITNLNLKYNNRNKYNKYNKNHKYNKISI